MTMDCYNRPIPMRETTSPETKRWPVFACTSALLISASLLQAQANQATGKKKMTDPIAVHQSAIVIDTHADTPQRFVDESWDFTDPLNGGMLNYDSAKKSNLAAQFFSIWVDPGQYPAKESAHRTLSLIDCTLDQFPPHPVKLQLCLPSHAL